MPLRLIAVAHIPPPSAATAPAKAGEPRGEWLLLRAEPLTRTDSWITSTVKSQHISGVEFGCLLHKLRKSRYLPETPDTEVSYTNTVILQCHCNFRAAFGRSVPRCAAQSARGELRPSSVGPSGESEERLMEMWRKAVGFRLAELLTQRREGPQLPA